MRRQESSKKKKKCKNKMDITKKKFTSITVRPIYHVYNRFTEMDKKKIIYVT